MNFIDENGRVGGKINLVDLLVLILVVLIVALAAVRLGGTRHADSGVSLDTLSYQVEIAGVRSFTADALREGDALYDSQDGVLLGTIADVQVNPATEAVRGLDGTYALGPVENRCDVTLTVEGEAETSNGRHFVGGTHEISVNAAMELRTKYAKFSARVTEID